MCLIVFFLTRCAEVVLKCFVADKVDCSVLFSPSVLDCGVHFAYSLNTIDVDGSFLV